MKHMFCEFENTGTKFNNRDIYACKYCSTKLLLDDPDHAKVLCFAKREFVNELATGRPDDSIDGLNESNFIQHALQKALKTSDSKQVDKNPADELSPEDLLKATEGQSALCSEEQIQSRLDICKNCEYYQEDACMLCGCVIVREANYRNKLALKHQSCPISKWGQIKE